MYNIHAFFYKQHLYKQHFSAKLKLVRNQTNAKQHPEVELLLSEYYSHSSSTLSSKNSISKNKQNNKMSVFMSL